MATQEATKKDKEIIGYDFIRYVYACMKKGVQHTTKETDWVGVIKTNKDVDVILWSQTGRNKEVFKIKGGKATKIGLPHLEFLIQKAVQEGPLSMREDFFVREGDALDSHEKNPEPCPLEFEILSEDKKPGLPADFKSDLIPTEKD